jgi:fibronectin type 3 domain-containing protein
MPRIPALRARARARARVLIVVAAVAALVVGFTGPALADVSNAPAHTWATNGRVLAILPIDADQVIVAGTFTQVTDPAGHASPANNIASFDPTDGTFDTSWLGGADDAVNALAISGSTLYIGGLFAQVDGVTRHKLAALNATTGSLVTTWRPGVDLQVDQLAVVGSNVYATGIFQDVTDTSGTYLQPYVARFDATSGTFDQSWRPEPNGRVRAIIGSADSTRVFIGGDFTSVSGATWANTTASLSVSTGAVDTTYRPAPNNVNQHASVYDIRTDSTGTQLILAVGGGGGACTDENAATGANIWSHHTNGNLQAVRIVGSTVYCGGHFNGSGSFDGFDRNKLAAVDLASGAVLDFAPTVNSALGVWYMGADDTHLYVGGDFTKISGVNQPHFAMFVDLGSQTVPLTPLALTAEPGDGAVFLSWDPPSGDGGSKVQAYYVYRAVGTGKLKKVGTAKTPGYTDGTAVNGTTYTYRVAAKNALGTGPQTGPVTATPQSGSVTAPGAPTNLTSVGQAGQIQLTWDAPANDGHSPITNYAILRGTAVGQETLLTTVGNVTSYVDTSVVVGTRYFYEVEAVNAVGPSNPSGETSAAANSGVPSPPTLSGTASGGKITLTWNYPNDNGSPITKFVLVKDGIRIATPPGTTLTYIDSAVTVGTLYHYQVKATNAVGTSKFSNTLMITAQ